MQSVMAYSHYAGTEQGQGIGSAQWETRDPDFFLGPVWPFLYNTSVPIAPSPIPCTCPVPVPVQCE